MIGWAKGESAVGSGVYAPRVRWDCHDSGQRVRSIALAATRRASDRSGMMTVQPASPNNEPLRILIVDDEPFAVRRIKAMIAREGGLDVVGVATSPESFTDAVATLDPEIVVADASLSPRHVKGIHEEEFPPLVLLSVSEHDAFGAFEVGACDLIVKPIENARLAMALRRAAAVARGRRALNDVISLKAANARLRAQIQPPCASFVQELWLRNMGGEAVRLPVSLIDWVSRLDNYVSIHAEGRQHLYRTSLSRLAAKLNPNDFVRLHRSALVRVDRIRCLKRATQDRVDVILTDGTRLPAGRTHGRALRSRMLRRGANQMCNIDDTATIECRLGAGG